MFFACRGPAFCHFALTVNNGTCVAVDVCGTNMLMCWFCGMPAQVILTLSAKLLKMSKYIVDSSEKTETLKLPNCFCIT